MDGESEITDYNVEDPQYLVLPIPDGLYNMKDYWGILAGKFKSNGMYEIGLSKLSIDEINFDDFGFESYNMIDYNGYEENYWSSTNMHAELTDMKTIIIVLTPEQKFDDEYELLPDEVITTLNIDELAMSKNAYTVTKEYDEETDEYIYSYEPKTEYMKKAPDSDGANAWVIV